MIPAIPTQFYVQQANAQVYLSWSIIAGATSYDVQRSLDGVSYSSVATPATNDYLDISVTVGVQYYYKVASVNGDGTSPYTLAQSVVPATSGNMSLGQVRLLAKQRADRVNSNFVTVPEWNEYIRQSYYELYDLLITAYEDYYLADPVTFVTDGSAEYTLPNGVLYSNARPFYKITGVDCGLSANDNAFVTLQKFNFIDRNKYVYPQLTSTFLGVFNLSYRVMGDKLKFIPTPAGGQFIRLWYIPRQSQPLKDTDMLDGISGWTEYVITDAAIKALQKEESDVSVLMIQKQALLTRIEAAAQNRDAGQPDTVSDVQFSNRWGNAYGPNGNGSYGGF